MARYKCLTMTFIAPYRFAEGETFSIDDSWEPGPHVEPLNDAAEAAMKKYEESRPHFDGGLDPIEALPNQMQPTPEGPAEGKVDEPTISLAEAASGDVKAAPGLDGGGKATKVS